MKRLLYKKLMLVLAVTRSVVYAHKKRQQDTVEEDEVELYSCWMKSTHGIRSMAHGE
jgi:hypothetical protein